MKTKEDLQKEHELLTKFETEISIPIEINLPCGITIKKVLKVDLSMLWDSGFDGNVWIDDPTCKGSNILSLQAIVDEINEQYDAKIKQFCKDSDEFEAAGGEVDWF